MDAEGGKLNKIFANNRALRIPYFQRSYVWTKTEWLRFVEDLQHVALVKKPYFLGSIILKSEDVSISGAGEQYFVVDGQQRLTTLIIFYRALFTVMAKNDEFRKKFIIEDVELDESERSQPILIHNKFDRVIFDKICNNDPLAFSKSEKSYQIAKAYDFFLNFLKRENNDPKENLDLEVDYNGIYIALRDHILLVTILLQNNENEQQIFDTINAAGRKLTTGELLKNFFFNDQNETVYEQEWSPVFDNDEGLYKYWTSEITSGKTSDNNIEGFFYALMQIAISDRSYGISVSSDDKKVFRHRDGGMFNNYKSLINDYNLNKDEFIHIIVKYAKAYRDSFPVDTLKEKISDEFSLQRLCNLMFASNSWTLVPYLLYILDKVSDKTEQKRIFAYLESYLMRRMICKSSNNNYSDFFSENLIGQGKCSYSDLKDYVDRKSQNDSLAMPNDDTVLRSLKENELSGNTAKIILFMLESRLSGKKDFYSYDSICAIPLIPKTPKNGQVLKAWPLGKYTIEERDNCVATLGNWSICSTKKVAKKVIESPWVVKKSSIKDIICFAENTNADVISSLNNWDEDFIMRRNAGLHNLIISTWKTTIDIQDIKSVEDGIEQSLDSGDDGFDENVNLSDNQKQEILKENKNVILKDDLEESLWELLHDKTNRLHFKRYLVAQNTRTKETENILHQIRIFLYRIKSSVPADSYRGISCVSEIIDLFNRYGEKWKAKSIYPQQHLFCIEFIYYIQKLKCGATKPVMDVRVRSRTKIEIILDGESKVLDPTDALEMVVNLVGCERILNSDVRLVGRPLLSKTRIQNYRDCGKYWLNNGGSPKDKYKAIIVLKTIYRQNYSAAFLSEQG